MRGRKYSCTITAHFLPIKRPSCDLPYRCDVCICVYTKTSYGHAKYIEDMEMSAIDVYDIPKLCAIYITIYCHAISALCIVALFIQFWQCFRWCIHYTMIFSFNNISEIKGKADRASYKCRGMPITFAAVKLFKRTVEDKALSKFDPRERSSLGRHPLEPGRRHLAIAIHFFGKSLSKV